MLQFLFENALDAIVVFDGDGRITDANPAACALFQVTREEALRHHLDDFFPEGVCQRLAAGETGRGDSNVQPREGPRVPVEYRGKRDFIPGRSLVVLRDIAERQRVEAQLRSSAEFVARLIEASHDCIKVLDLEGRLVSMNEGGRRLLEIDDLSRVLGTPWLDLWTGGDKARAAEAVDKARAGEVARFEAFGPTAKGSGRWWETVIAPVHDAAGRPERLLAVSRDVTDRVTAERERHAALERMRAVSEDANRAKDEFIATLAHELRNPLGAIVTAVAALDAIGAMSPTAKSARAVIRRQSDHMARLLDDLLDVTRISEGKIVLRVDSTNLCAVVEAALDGERPRIERKCQQVHAILPVPPVLARVDAVRMRQMASNLINNACKYTPAGGTLTVEVGMEGGQALLRVSDTGEGVPPDRIEDIFGLFTQLHQGGHGEGGLGIGLTLVRRLAQLHGGSVRAWSAGPGQGTTFEVRVPLASGAEPAGEASETADAGRME